ncbi:hypothetical protein HNP47_001213 [Brevundimonas vesicularis]|uniref:Uncharacterized protein n=1 Tax=Brevundimonas vesicularis TaxID=41276 RepID=A0A7W9FTD8_BREVE|nr:hypothetical protein [Brevundimonas vesicularis]
MISELKIYLGICVGMALLLAGLLIWRPDTDVKVSLIVVLFSILAAVVRSNIQLAKRMEAQEDRHRAGEAARSESRT